MRCSPKRVIPKLNCVSVFRTWKIVRIFKILGKHSVNLAFMYAHGQSVKADYHKAAMWYEVSRRLGFNTIQKNMEFVFSKLTTEQAQTAQTLASNCMEADYKGFN